MNYFSVITRRELLLVSASACSELSCVVLIAVQGKFKQAWMTWGSRDDLEDPLEHQESAGQSPRWQPLFKMTSWSLPHPFFLQTLEMGSCGSNEKPCKPPKHGWPILMSVWFHQNNREKLSRLGSTLVGTVSQTAWTLVPHGPTGLLCHFRQRFQVLVSSSLLFLCAGSRPCVLD